MNVAQQTVSQRGTRAECSHCEWRLTIREARGKVGTLRTEAMKHVRRTGHTVYRHVENIVKYSPEEGVARP
jgi:hypothetical protein